MFKVYLYVAELLRAELHDRKPAEKPEDVSWEKVCELSKAHMMTGLTFDSILKLQNKPEGKLYQQWKELADKALVKEISFDAEREQIFEAFEENQVKYIPLKGIIIKDFYARPGLRQFSDNDILYYENGNQKVKDIMEQLGYECESEGDHHDEYRKPPIYNFELHMRLLPKDNKYLGEFDNIWERAIKDEGNQMGYHMTDEDFYVYHLVHLEKHFDGSGTGLRYFVDQYYLNQCLVTRMDRKLLDQRLSDLGLLDFEQRINGLSETLFGQSDVDWEHVLDGNEQQKELFLYIMSCGAYGTFHLLVQNRIRKAGSKGRYFISRLTCDDIYMKNDYPILKKCPWLKPVFVVWRLVSAPFKKPDRVKEELMGLFGKKTK